MNSYILARLDQSDVSVRPDETHDGEGAKIIPAPARYVEAALAVRREAEHQLPLFVLFPRTEATIIEVTSVRAITGTFSFQSGNRCLPLESVELWLFPAIFAPNACKTPNT